MIIYTFKNIDITQAQDLIQEADEGEFFLSSRSDPKFLVMEFLLEKSKKEGFHLFVAVNSENTQLGFISLFPYKENIFAIGPMYIKKEFQGRGIGKFQVVNLMKWAREKGIRELFTKTWGHNTASRKIFESVGFIIDKEILNDRVDGDSTINYKLKL